jgi:hypothetical protein
VYLRKTDGSPAIKLGDGFAGNISPDGRFVLSSLPSDFSNIIILPTGPGQPRTISLKDFAVNAATGLWFKDGKRFLFSGLKSGNPSRVWMHDLETGRTQPVTPEGVSAGLISPDQMHVLSPLPGAGYGLYPVAGGDPRPVRGLEREDALMNWTVDDQAVFVGRGFHIPARIDRVDLVTGQRTLWKEIVPQDPTGIAGLINMVITPDGKSYAYTYRRVLSDLYLVSGLQ